MFGSGRPEERGVHTSHTHEGSSTRERQTHIHKALRARPDRSAPVLLLVVLQAYCQRRSCMEQPIIYMGHKRRHHTQQYPEEDPHQRRLT